MTCCAHTFTRRHWMWNALVTSAGAALAACSTGRSGPAAGDLRGPGRRGGQAPPGHGLGGRAHPRRRDRRDLEERARRRSRARHARGPHLRGLPRRRAGRPHPRPEREQCPGGAAAAGSRGSSTSSTSSASRGWTSWSRVTGCAGRSTVADLKAAHAAGEPAIILDIEGLDFLETKLERLEESHRRGVRTMQLVHYTPNDIGDFQTGAVVHNGLTPFGADVIRACNRLGVVVDVAHATGDTVKQAVKVSSKPLLLSHTALRGSRAQGTTPLTERQITPDHARAIAETGGSIGIWHFFASPEQVRGGDQGDGRRRGRRARQHRHRPVGERGALALVRQLHRWSWTRCSAGGSPPRTPPRSSAATT